MFTTIAIPVANRTPGLKGNKTAKNALVFGSCALDLAVGVTAIVLGILSVQLGLFGFPPTVQWALIAGGAGYTFGVASGLLLCVKAVLSDRRA